VTYRAAPVTQRDGSSLENSNCRYASIATGIDYHTLGKTKSTGKKMRDYSNDPSGGSWSADGVRAWENGYDMKLGVDDGETWDDAVDMLHEGRLVHLEVWSAQTGGPCCTSACGHVMAVAPESRQNSNGDWEWLVADPWCKPPKWVWWRASRLRSGAEEWADRCGFRSAQGGGPRDIRDLHRERLAVIVKELMGRWTPDRPLKEKDDDYEPSLWLQGGATGGAPILFTHTKAQTGVQDVAINTSANDPVTSSRRVALSEGTDFFSDAALTRKLADLSNDRVVPLLGTAVGEDGRAVVINTSHPYSDGEARPTIVYVRESALGAITHED